MDGPRPRHPERARTDQDPEDWWRATADACRDALDRVDAARIGAVASVQVDPRLAELDFGEGEGLTPEEMRERFPDPRAPFERDPAAHHLPGGESPQHALDRALACLHEIARRNHEARVMVVIHPTLIRLLMCHLLELPLKDYRRRLPTVSYATLTELRLRDGEAALLTFNALPVATPRP
jgi:broad specificity phosphatase PhoE